MRSSEPRWRHPELQPGWIDRPHRKVELGDFTLESGEVIRNFEISYVTHGTLAPAADNAILALTAIGSIHHRLDFLIGQGRPLDPARHFIVCVDAIGNGMTTSPSNSRTQPDLKFPRFAIRDMVASQQKLLDVLGIGRLAGCCRRLDGRHAGAAMGRQRSRSRAQHRRAGTDGPDAAVGGRHERGRAPHPDGGCRLAVRPVRRSLRCLGRTKPRHHQSHAALVRSGAHR